MVEFSRIIFALDVAANFVLLIGIAWSVAIPHRRIWPPPRRRSWQYALTWTCFYVAFAGNAALMVLDWNSWVIHGPVRFFLGVPLVIVGALLFSWSVLTLGVRNTSGVRDGFFRGGPYRFTRNPQYLGDMTLFVGLSVIANSLSLWVTHGLIIMVFLMAPWIEEVWLEDQYGEVYEEYRRSTSRFL